MNCRFKPVGVSRLLVILFLLLVAQPIVYAQKVYLSGRVTDANGPVEGAYIIIQPGNKATISVVGGTYRIRIPNRDSLVIICQCIGYATQRVKYKGQKTLNFRLVEDSHDIKEVIVRARPNINALDVRSRTGNIEEVNMPRAKAKPLPNLALALQGAVPGLQITNRGMIGEPPKIRIRGTSSFRKGDKANEPLYVLDGQIISAETFQLLNIEEIDKIKVLKDAVGTALYGIRAANGVVELSTKRFSGEGLSVTYRGEAGVTFRGPRSVQMMKTDEKLDLERLLKHTGSPGFIFSEEYIRKQFSHLPNVDELVADGARKLDSLRGINTDWFKVLIKPNYYHRHTLTLRAGSGNTSYSLSAGFMQQGGKIDGNMQNRGTMRLSVEQRFSSRAVASLSLSGGYLQSKTPFGSDFNPLELIYRLNPYESEKSLELWSYPNRRYSDLMGQYTRTSTTKNVGVFSSLNWELIDGLELSAICGLDLSLLESLMVTPATAYNEIRSGAPREQRGRLRQSKGVQTGITTGLRLNFSRTWGIHDFTVGGDVDFHTDITDDVYLTGYGLYGNVMSAAAIDNGISGGRRARVGATKYTHRDVGLGMLVGYTLLEQYDIFSSVKFDASSVLPRSKRWNQAWSLGLGWDLKKYPWLRDQKWLRGIKLRASMGYTANLNGVSAASTINTFIFSPNSYASVRPMELMALANTELKAEQNEIYDIGMHMSVPYVNFSLSFYRRVTHEALLDMPIPTSNGFESQLQNIGSLRNEGVELSLRINAVDMSEWRFSVSGNIAYNRSKVLELNGKPRIYSSLEAILPDYEVGQPIDGVWGLNSLGISPLTGLPVYVDHEGNEQDAYHTFVREDFVWLGHSTPPVSGGFTLSLAWRNLSIDCDFYYTIGAKRMVSYTYVRDISNANQNAIKGQVGNTWWKPGDVNKVYPFPFMLAAGYENVRARPSTRTVLRTDFLRCTGVSLRYSFDDRFLKWMKNVFSYGHVALQGSNLFTITPFSSSDPETGDLVGALQPIMTLNLTLNF